VQIDGDDRKLHELTYVLFCTWNLLSLSTKTMLCICLSAPSCQSCSQLSSYYPSPSTCPTIHWKCLYTLTSIMLLPKTQKSTWLPLHTPTPLQLAAIQKSFITQTKLTTSSHVVCRCQAIFRTRDYLCTP